MAASGPAQRRQKCLPIDVGEEERKEGKTHAVCTGLARTAEANTVISGESLLRDITAVVCEKERVNNVNFQCFPHVPRLPALLLRDFHAARLSPKQRCHRDHGKTWPGTHLPLKTSSLIQARERDKGMNCIYCFFVSASIIVQYTVQHACKSYQWT